MIWIHTWVVLFFCIFCRDHVGGSNELKQLYPGIRVYGGEFDNVPDITQYASSLYLFLSPLLFLLSPSFSSSSYYHLLGYLLPSVPQLLIYYCFFFSPLALLSDVARAFATRDWPPLIHLSYYGTGTAYSDSANIAASHLNCRLILFYMLTCFSVLLSFHFFIF